MQIDMELTLTADDLPQVADQLDTIAEHDLQNIEGDLASDAIQKIRQARVLLLDAAELLERATADLGDERPLKNGYEL